MASNNPSEQALRRLTSGEVLAIRHALLDAHLKIRDIAAGAGLADSVVSASLAGIRAMNRRVMAWLLLNVPACVSICEKVGSADAKSQTPGDLHPDSAG